MDKMCSMERIAIYLFGLIMVLKLILPLFIDLPILEMRNSEKEMVYIVSEMYLRCFSSSID